jgi:TolB-like protein
MLFEAFAHTARTREGAEHLEAATRVFEAEGLDPAPLRAAWAAAVKGQRSAANPTSVIITPAPIASAITPPPMRRASIAVMPLADLSVRTQDRLGGLANALVHDVITRLAKLRSVAVIAQGTVFALGARGIGASTAGRTLDVDYVASGSLRRHEQRVTVMIELVETRTAHIVWAEDFDYALDDALLVLEEIGNRIVGAIASEIESAERKRALLKPPESLDAWEAYHRGLWHMYRFDADDNDRAQHFFERAVQLDPTFSRAHAGLSFTHFQNAFLHRIPDRSREIDRAFATASQGLIADERDPAAHWAMGRALWLRGRQDECLRSLDRAVELSPNFASGHYTLAFVHSQSGDPRAAIASADTSRHLSPFDPLLFAMMASRALALVRLGEADEAATWAVSAAARPNAHVHVRAIAAHCLAAASRLDEANQLVTSIHKTHPSYGIQDFLTAFRFDPESAALFKGYARRIGIG